MTIRFTIFFFVLLLLASPAAAQSASAGQAPAEEQNETMLDTLKRMQIKREEEEHKKLVGKGTQIQQDAEALAKEAVGNSLPRVAEKKLREIEKSAKQIRSEFGGGEDEPLKSPPENLTDALKELNEKSERLNKELDKTSRRVISFTVIEVATEIIQLTRLVRGYLL